jgi:hypothetical protein
MLFGLTWLMHLTHPLSRFSASAFPGALILIGGGRS